MQKYLSIDLCVTWYPKNWTSSGLRSFNGTVLETGDQNEKVCRQKGGSDAAFHRWKEKFPGINRGQTQTGSTSRMGAQLDTTTNQAESQSSSQWPFRRVTPFPEQRWKAKLPSITLSGKQVLELAKLLCAE
jgi:hypothetical protein